MSKSTKHEKASTHDQRNPPTDTNSDRLALIYCRPGPYASVYLATRPLLPHSENDTHSRWQALRNEFETKGVSSEVLRSMDADLSAPTPEDTAAIAVIAAADGTTLVDYGQEPPREDVAVFDSLPYAAPILEWEQRRLSHLVVTIDDEGADIATFTKDQEGRVVSMSGSTSELVDPVAALAHEINARLVVVSGQGSAAQRLASELALRVPIDCRIVAEPGVADVDELAEAAVRHVSDTVARGTVGYLRELRFLASHDAAVDGTAETIQALREATADVLLIHDDPSDERRLWIGSDPNQISLEPMAGFETEARLVDAAIRVAVLTGVSVHIIPTTGPNGPDDNTAALQRATPADNRR